MRWERWQGHAVNGVFPLQRYLGASDHSAVFLTQLAKRQPSTVAIKLVSAGRGDPALVDAQLARWKIASRIAHPHLLTLLEVGRCELDGAPCAYAVMEYADQTLAQLLLHRALTEDEAREMLVPALDALAFLHGRGFMHGGLKPPNVLVVGEKLKLASDTLRVSSSTAADIRGLGCTLVEALTRRAPMAPSAASGDSGRSGSSDDAVALPENVSPGLRAMLARCLGRPENQPDVSELRKWIDARPGGRLPSEAPAPAARALEARVPEPRAREPRVLAPPAESRRPERRASLPVVSAIAAALVLGWLAVHQMRKTHSLPPTPAISELQASPPGTATAAVQGPITAGTTAGTAGTTAGTAATTAGTAATTAGIAGNTAGIAGTTAAIASATASPRTSGGTASAPRIHEAIPAVPRRARETIQGHVQVWVRVSVDKEGRVFAVHADRPGPSRYFERLAIEASRKWTFPPVETPASRLMQVRFEFSRSGTTGHAVTLP
jgi:TonB family protein